MKPNKILITLLAAGSIYTFSGCGDKQENNLQNTPVDVQVEPVKNSDGSMAFAYSGAIEESESTPLSFSVVGTVSKVYVSEGDYVKKGELLAELNDETYKNAYQMTEAALKQAEDAYKRLEPMYKNGNLPEIKFVEIETSLQQAKSAAAISKKNVDDCKLYSPVDGIVGKRSLDPGMSALPNLASINIVKIKKVFARVAISENEISFIKKGAKAEIKIAALDNAFFTGKVEEIGVMADPIAHTYKIKIGIANSAGNIKPGMICNVILSNKGKSSTMSVADRAVLVDETGRNFVYAVDESKNRAVRKYVKTGKLLNGSIEILEGLNIGEPVVIAGQQKLADNSPVHISNR